MQSYGRATQPCKPSTPLPCSSSVARNHSTTPLFRPTSRRASAGSLRFGEERRVWLKDTQADVAECLWVSRELGFHLGAKLVRGAYLDQKRAVATLTQSPSHGSRVISAGRRKRDSYCSLRDNPRHACQLQQGHDDTHRGLHLLVYRHAFSTLWSLQEVAKGGVAVCIGSHNLESLTLAQLRLNNTQRRSQQTEQASWMVEGSRAQIVAFAWLITTSSSRWHLV